MENYARAFPDMHRELHQVYVSGDIVVVQLALQGSHNGPLSVAGGTLEPTGNRMDAPCCDVFELAGGRTAVNGYENHKRKESRCSES